mgnify:FL=1
MKFISYILAGAALAVMPSCNDFLDTLPTDAMTPSTTWQTELDAQKFLVGCYDGWESGTEILYMDCTSDFGYNNFSWEGYKDFANGTISAANPGANFYDFTIIRRCNTFLENVEKITFADEKTKKDLIAQARVIRAYRYFKMNWLYGGVPIIENYESAIDAQIPKKTEAEVRTFIETELDTYTKDLNDKPAERGRIAQGAALAIRMREALYYGDWGTAKTKAQEIINLNQYDLEKGKEGYSKLFQVAGQDSKEIILAVQYINSTKPLGVIGQMYNNGDGGWSSIVPTYQLVDAYEMANGKTIDEDGSGYDEKHPFKGRDPRLALTVIYPGANYVKSDGSAAVFNTLDKELVNAKGEKASNPNFMTSADNASKTGLTWNKYLSPITQYTDIWNTNACPIVFRFAEVLLTWAEAENELNGPSKDVFDKIDEVRTRTGMPAMDRQKYNTKDKLRELIHRERSVEFAGEGLRRADILRWKDASGKMVAETVLNGRLERRVGTVDMNDSDPETRATIKLDASAEEKLIEVRKFEPKHRYFPFAQSILDKNPNLVQVNGYE